MAAWSNKHVIMAMLVAPVLALIAYFGIGALVGEDPQPAKAGQSYPLAEKPNCRYASGACGLKNAEFELTLSFDRLAGGRLLLKLASVHVLDGVMLAVAETDGTEQPPVAMRPEAGDGRSWSLEIDYPANESQRLHLVATTAGVYYFGDVATKFMQSGASGPGG